MIWIYRILYLPLLILFSPYYVYRMFRRGGYKRGFMQRFGLIEPMSPPLPGKKRIWLQAVSVGEILAVAPIIESLAKGGKTEVVLTTTTSTGMKVARERYGEITYSIGIFPLDFWLFSHTAWNRINPDMAILMESELWPEHIRQANRRKIEIILINARLSDNSYNRYKKLRFLFRGLTNNLSQILASSAQDMHRFRELGVASKKIEVAGNLKFDVSVEPLLDRAWIDALKEELGFMATNEEEKKPVILLGSSTWPGEEEWLLNIINEAQSLGLNCRLLLTPRHAERRGEIKKLLATLEFPFHFRSEGKKAPGLVMIYVGDTTGELKMLTQAADLVFIGKSLPPNAGGQTPIEAAALGKPLVFGPAMSNFSDVCRSLLKSGAARQVSNGTELQETILHLLKDSHERASMAQAAQKWHAENQGAAQVIQREIENRLRSRLV